MTTVTHSRERQLGWPFALACSPLLVGLVLILLMRPRAGAVGAILLGPWAGLVYGHHDCTLGRTWPEASFTCLGLLAPVLLLALVRPRPLRDPYALSVFALWSLLWAATAVLSVVNTLE